VAIASAATAANKVPRILHRIAILLEKVDFEASHATICEPFGVSPSVRHAT
jgi:hypothetical protein